MLFILNKLEQLSRAELSAVYFHAENLMYRGFKIISVKITQNERFFVVNIISHNDKREVNRVRNYPFYTETELNYFIKLLNENGYIFTIEREVQKIDI